MQQKGKTELEGGKAGMEQNSSYAGTCIGADV